MTEMPEIGKISPDVFEKMILPLLGAKDKRSWSDPSTAWTSA